MKINFPKTKFLLFSPTKNYDFIPQLTMDGYEFDTVEEMKLLGRSHLSYCLGQRI